MQTSLLRFTRVKPWSVAADRVRRLIELFRPRFLYVMFSGGRDSAAVLASALEATDRVVAVYLRIAGQTHVDNVRAALGVARRLGLEVVDAGVARRGALRGIVQRIVEERDPPIMLHVTTVDYRLGCDYWSAVRVYGFPAPSERWGGGKRWCCSHFKSEWLSELPPNAVVGNKPARVLAVGVRMEESTYRARLWGGADRRLPVRAFKGSDGVDEYALAPVYDMSTADVDDILRHYGLYDVVSEQYKRWKRSPNCSLCPLMGKEAFARAVSNLPEGYLRRVLQVLREIRPRYREGTFSAKRIDEWIAAIEARLSGGDARG